MDLSDSRRSLARMFFDRGPEFQRPHEMDEGKRIAIKIKFESLVGSRNESPRLKNYCP